MREVAARETEPQATVPGPVERDLRHNFAALLGHGLLGQTGFRLIQAPTFLPYFVSTLAGSDSAAPLMRAMQSLGQFASPMLSASIAEHRRRTKGLALLFGSGMRLQVLFLALIALFVPAENALVLVFCVAGLLGLSLGLQGVVFQFVMSKAIPVERRGMLFGLRNASASVTLVFVALLGGFLVERYGFPHGYGYTFLVGFVLTSLGLVAFGLVREPDSLDPRPRMPFQSRLREIPGLLRAEPQFRRYLTARLIGTAARGVLPLYIGYIAATFGVSGRELGLLTTAFVVVQGASGLLWGPLADRLGFKVIFSAALLCWIAGTSLLLVTPVASLTYLVYALVGAGLGGFQLASQNLVLEFGSERDRAMRIATSNSLSELIGSAGFAGAAGMAYWISLDAVFITSIVLQLAALLLIQRVVEPRTHIDPIEVE